MKQTSWRRNLLFASIIILSIAAPKSIAQSNESTRRQVTLQLKWKHQFQFAGYYAAVEQGYYSDLGLDVNIVEASGSDWPGNAVFDGRAEFGVATTELMLHRNTGKPAVVLAPIFQHSPYNILALKDAGIENIQDLTGKRIMIDSRSADIVGYMKSEGVPLSNVQNVPYDFNVDKLLNGEIDAVSAYMTDSPFILKENAREYILLSPASGGIDFYGDMLFTSQNLIESDPEMVANFREASLKGWKYAVENSDEIIELIHREYSQRLSIEHLRFEAMKTINLIVWPIIEIGYSNPGRWGHIANIYQQEGMISDDFDISPLLYETYTQSGMEVPWRLIRIFSAAILIIVLAALFFRRSAQRLKVEVLRRTEVEDKLLENQARLTESNNSKDKFFSIIAHDLRSPFNSMLGMSNLLLLTVDSSDKKTVTNNLQLIRDTATSTLELLTNLLDWSSAQVGRIAFQPNTLSVNKLLDSNIKFAKAQATRKTIEIEYTANPNLEIVGDWNMLNTVVRNILSNAIKFSNDGGRISISAQQDSKQCSITISDNGIGIDQETRNRLFDVGAIEPSKGTSEEPGFGLGLLLCKEFVNYHKGEIEIESQPNQGSSFNIILPKTLLSPA
ncbi:MAG: signal transduction histidine kinase [Candidatus Pelagisphaera sp.]|jgi:signal transduction histidine kinase